MLGVWMNVMSDTKPSLHAPAPISGVVTRAGG
jgi:hypothetical protein